MTEREKEITEIIQIVSNLLSESELSLGTLGDSPIIVKDEITGKIYGVMGE